MEGISRIIHSKIYIKSIIILAIGLLTEVFLFNFRYWESLTFTKIENYDISIGEGIVHQYDDIYQIVDDTAAYVELTNIDCNVRNIYIDFFPDSEVEESEAVIPIQIEKTDAADAIYARLPMTEISHGVYNSMYKRLFLVGSSPKLKINILDRNGWFIQISKIGLNVVRPFGFSIIRFAFITLIIAVLCLFRPGSELYRLYLLRKNAINLILIISVCLINIAAVAGISIVFGNKNWQEDGWLANLQYNYLAESLSEGHTYLNFDPPESLETMDNPYDPTLRGSVLSEAGESAIYDFAYYKGRYYCYFGIVPVLLFYLPYLLITGEQLYAGTLIMIEGVLFVIVVFWFVFTICKKFFKNTSLGVYLVLCTVLVASSEISYCLQYSSIYTVPIATGLLFDLLGLTCWLNAVKSDDRISKLMLVLGSVCIALVIGCRPQMAIVLFFAFPIFAKQIKERKFFSVSGIWNTLAVIIPFLVIGTALMFYNYIRFDEFLNFGATYNITSHDMTHRGFILDRMYTGFFEYFLQPFKITAEYPYVSIMAEHSKMPTDFQGQINNEPYLGGYFAFNLIGVFLIYLGLERKKLKDAGALWIVYLSLVIGFIIATIDIQLVGMTLRYLSEISLFISIPVIIIIASMFDRQEEGRIIIQKRLLYAFCLLSVLCVFTNCWTLFASGRYNDIIYVSPHLYYYVKYMLFMR